MPDQITLKDFVAQHSQHVVAGMMGVSQGAVSQMIKAKRDIRVCEDANAKCGYRFYEIRIVGKYSKAA